MMWPAFSSNGMSSAAARIRENGVIQASFRSSVVMVAAAATAAAAGRSRFRGTNARVASRAAASRCVRIGRDTEFAMDCRTAAGGALFRLAVSPDEFFEVFPAVVALILVNGHKNFPFHKQIKLKSLYIIPFPEKKERKKRKDFKIFTKFSKKSKFPLQKMNCKCNI